MALFLLHVVRVAAKVAPQRIQLKFPSAVKQKISQFKKNVVQVAKSLAAKNSNKGNLIYILLG